MTLNYSTPPACAYAREDVEENIDDLLRAPVRDELKQSASATSRRVREEVKLFRRS